jgi:uncharacterized protein YdeI (YjbR/CyaY-like superfamily)
MKAQSKKKQTLKRALNQMPRGIHALLVKNGLLENYQARPPYQQNDYLGWISRAKLEATKQKRIKQMLDELKQGDRYMKMRWGGQK